MSNNPASQAKPSKQPDWHQLSFEKQKELAKASPMYYTRNCFDMPKPRSDQHIVLR